MSIIYSKIPWIQNTDTIKVTQGFHGKAQNGAAMDFSKEELVAPCDLEITLNQGSGGQQYFHAKLLGVNGNVYIQCVHGRPARMGKFSKGEVFGYTNPYINPVTKKREDHWHLAINVNGEWKGLMTYIEQNKSITLIGSPWSNPYDQWSFYVSRTIAFFTSAPVFQTPPPANDIPFTPPSNPDPTPTVEPDPTPTVNPCLECQEKLQKVESDYAQLAITLKDKQATISLLEYENSEKDSLIKELQKAKVETTNSSNKPFWQSKKFYVTMSGIIGSVVVALNLDPSTTSTINQTIQVLGAILSPLGITGVYNAYQSGIDKASIEYN